MSPAFCDRDYVISLAWRRGRYRKGDVVIVRHPRYHTIIKRILQVNGRGDVLLVGDNPVSTSTPLLGWQPRGNIIGKVLWRVRA